MAEEKAVGSFPYAGEWPCYHRDGTMQARSPLKGNISDPEVVWSHFVGTIESLLVVDPSQGNTNLSITGEESFLESDETQNERWNWPTQEKGYVEGKVKPIKNTETTTYADILPDNPGLDKLDFSPGADGNRRGRLFTWRNDAWELVWETEESWPAWNHHPCPLVGDFDSDGKLEVVYLPWYEMVILDAITGERKDSVGHRLQPNGKTYAEVVGVGLRGEKTGYRINANGRSYGFFGVYDLNNDGLSEFVIISDFARHITVIGYRDGKLSVLWKREFEGVIYQQKLVVVKPNPVADVDGDGEPEIIVCSLNDAGDWRWSITVHNCLTGEVKAELYDECLYGVIDINGDGICEILTLHSEKPVPPPYGKIRAYSLSSGEPKLIWEQNNSLWELVDRPMPMNVSVVNDSCPDRRDILHRVIDDQFFAVIRSPIEGGPEYVELSTISWNGDAFDSLTTIKGPQLKGLAIDKEGSLLVCSESAPGREYEVTVTCGSAKTVQSRKKGDKRIHPIVAWDSKENLPMVIVNSSQNFLLGFHPPKNGEPVSERWRIPGLGHSLVYVGGTVIADLKGDGGRQHLYVTAAPEGHARLVAAELDGKEVWHYDFPRIRGIRVREETDGMSDVVMWQTGHLTDPKRHDIVVQVRRGVHTTEETYALSGIDGHLLWHRDIQIAQYYNRPIGGLPFVIADFDGDGLDEVVDIYFSKFQIIQGDTGDNMLFVNTMEPQLDGAPPVPGLDRPLVAVDLGNPHGVVAFNGHGLGKPHKNIIWSNKDGQLGSRPMCGDFDGDGKLEGLVMIRSIGLRCYDLSNGEIKWQLPLDISFYEFACADVDNDGKDEALLLAGDRIYCVGTNGAAIEGLIKWEVELPRSASSIIIADLEGNGTASILLGNSDGYLYCVR